MQRRRLARAGRATDEKEAVRLFDCILALLQVVLGKPQLIERYRFAGGEDTHHDVFDAALRWNRGNAQLDVERAELLELDLAVLRLAPLGYIEVAHDLEARGDRIAIGGRHRDIIRQRAVFAEAHLRLALAGIRLDVNVRRALLVGVDDDLVDELDDFVIRGRRGDVLVGVLHRVAVLEPRQQVADIGAVVDVADARRSAGGAEEQIQRRGKFTRTADAVNDPAFRIDVVDDLRPADFFRVRRQYHDPVFRLVDRDPQAAFDEFAAHVLHQIHRLDAIGLVRLVRDVEVRRERLADRA